jgi:FtsP/CotA-like multicopper oxidase with cupredoxin domain
MRCATIGLVMVVGLLGTVRVGAAKPPPFSNPPELASVAGQLTGTLTVAPGEVELAGKQFTTTLFNGAYMPPVLRVQPGDRIRLALANGDVMPTNLHYHGFAVTPLAPGDDVFLTVNPGATFQYDFLLPADHASGLFWYHPHFHPDVNPQIAAGLSGGIVVGDVLAPFPQLAGITERVMLLKDMKLRRGRPVVDPDPTGATIRTINGLYQPRIDISPGELQLWRIGNIGANIYYKLRLPRHVFYVISQDGNPTTGLVEQKELLIPPAARYEVLVRGARPGKYRLKALAFNTGPQGDHYPAQVLATVVSKRPAVANPLPLPTVFPSAPDLRLAPITTRRTITFADASSKNPAEQFTINGRYYDHTRIDTTVELGAVEEWTIRNTSRELHVFHIHQTDFQVVEVDGEPAPFTGYQDTVSLPFAKRKKGRLVPGEVKVIVPFTNPVIVGEFVYHCHIVQHADQGMMANIQVVPPGGMPVGTAPPDHH